MNNNMIYIDREGGMGDASGLVIMMERDLGPNARKTLAFVADAGGNLIDWAYRQMVGLDKTTHIIGKTGVVASKQNLEDLEWLILREEAF